LPKSPAHQDGGQDGKNAGNIIQTEHDRHACLRSEISLTLRYGCQHHAPPAAFSWWPTVSLAVGEPAATCSAVQLRCRSKRAGS
jgi:hypothetical protein